MTDTQTLRPCDCWEDVEVKKQIADKWAIECINCGKGFYACMQQVTKSEFIEAWNTRAGGEE